MLTVKEIKKNNKQTLREIDNQRENDLHDHEYKNGFTNSLVAVILYWQDCGAYQTNKETLEEYCNQINEGYQGYWS